MKFFGYQIPEDVICEKCWFDNPQNYVACVDVHHVNGRGKGMDVIENLAGLCRIHHADCHNEVIKKDEMQAIHDKFMENNY
jgi:hypothetical protein